MSVDGGTTFYPIALTGKNRLTTHYTTGSYISVVFESEGAVD